MALIRYIPNRFVDKKYEFETKQTNLNTALHEIAANNSHVTKPLLGNRILVSVNNSLIKFDEWKNYSLEQNDVVEVTHSIEGDFGLSGLLQAALFLPTKAKAGFETLLWLSGGWLWELFEPPVFKDETESPTYGWDGATTSLQSDTPLMLIYGEHLVGGQLINFNIWSQGDDNYLDLLLALGEGEISGIVDEDQTGLVASIPTTLEDVDTKTPYIKINDQFVSAFENCEWAGRPGTNTQTSIKGFRDVKTAYDYAHKVPAYEPGNNWSLLYTTNTDIDQFTVNLSCPALFAVSKKGKLQSKSIKYRIRYRVNSPQGSWTTTDWYTISAKTKSEIKEYKTITVGSRDTYDIQVQRSSPASTQLSSENKLETTTITEIVSEDLAYPNTALIALRVKATDQISGTIPNLKILVRGLKVRVPDLAGDGSEEFEDYYWDTGNTFKRLSDEHQEDWDGSSYVTQWTSNPAYILRDFLINDRYGLGEVVTTSDLSESTINTAAKKCWQKVGTGHKNELHIVLDTEQDPESWLQQMAVVSRMFIYWSGGYIKFKYEEDEDPIQLFTMGNILERKFTTKYAEHTKIPNMVEVRFANKDNEWKTETIELVDETEWALGKPKRKMSMSLIGVTDSAQALREAKLALNRARYSRKTVEFSTTIAALNCEPGDIVAVQHDIPQWGWGGRVISGTSTTCVIDQDIPSNIVGDPTAYDIKVIHDDDSIETFDIASVSGKTVTIDGTFSTTPSEDEVYILGVVDSTIKEYRVKEVSLTTDDEISIIANEHSASIYSDTGMAISTDEASELPNPSAFAPAVSGLTLYELYNQVGFGISFRQPESTLVWDHADVYVSTDNIHFVKIAEGYGDDDIEYTGVLPGIKYYVKVYSINKVGIKNLDPATANITITGENVGDPYSPTGLEIFNQGNNTIFKGRDCKFAWRLNAPFGGAGSLDPEQPAGQGANDWAIVRDFQVEIWNSTGTTRWRTEFTTDKFYIYTWEKNLEDNDGTAQRTFQIKIYQRNWFGKISKIPATLTVNNSAPDMSTHTPTLTAAFKSFRADWSSYTPKDNDLDYFKVWYGTATPVTGSVDRISKSSRTTTVSGLSDNTKYYVRVEPYDLFGDGIDSAVASISIAGLDSTAPDTPTGLVFNSGVATDADGRQQVYLTASWDANDESDFDHYTLRYRQDSKSYYSYMDINTLATPNAFILPAKANTLYRGNVSAADMYGNESAWSAEATVTTTYDTQAPSAPTGLTALSGYHEVVAYWDKNTESDLKDYIIYTNESNATTTAASVAHQRGTYFRYHAALGSTLHFWVRARDTSDNISDFSSVASAHTAQIATTDLSNYKNYFKSGNNLITNGNAEFGNNYNFSDLIYTATPSGAYTGSSCFRTVSGRYPIIESDEFVAIDASSYYEYQCAVRVATQLAATPTRMYLGFKTYTGDHTYINTYNAWRKGGTRTYVTEEVSNGATIVKVNATPNWSGYTIKNSRLMLNPIAGGADLPNFQVYDIASLVASAPIVKVYTDDELPDISVGASVAYTAAITGYNYLYSNVLSSTNWKFYDLTTPFGGRVNATNEPPSDGTVFRRGSKYFKWMALANRVDVGYTNVTYFDAIELRKATGLGAIIAGAVNNSKLAADAITASVIAVGAIVASALAANSVAASHIQSAAVTEAKIKDQAITNAKITSDAITASVIANQAIVASKIAADAVLASNIHSAAVTETKIADTAVTNAKLTINSVTASVMANSAVVASKIANAAINNSHISAEAITASVMAADSILASHVTANAITTEKIDAGAITAAKISADAIEASHLKTGAITTRAITASAITASLLETSIITSNYIAASAIDADKLQANIITAPFIVSNAITTEKIDAGAITAAKISADAIEASHLKTGAVTTRAIVASAIAASLLETSIITSNYIAASAIETQHFKSEVIVASLMAANAILASHISAAAVTAAKLSAVCVEASHLAANAVTASVIAAQAVAASHLQADSVLASNIKSDTITTKHLAADSVVSSVIAAGNILTEHLSALCVEASNISAAAVEASHIKGLAIETQHLGAQVVEASNLAVGAIEASHITANAVLASNIFVSILSAICASMGTIQAGVLQSTDWAAAAGIKLDLDNKWIKMGGSNVNATGDAGGIFIGYQS